MIGLDTNILVRYFVQDDLVQAKAASLLLEHQLTPQDPGFVSIGTVLETIWVLKSRYRVPKDEMILVLERMLQTQTLTLQHRREVASALATWETETGSFSAILIGELNAAAGCSTTLTFDKQASRLPGFSLL